MRYFAYTLFVLLTITAFGCKTEIKDQYTDQIDSAIAVIEAAQQAANALPVEKLKKVKPVYAKYVEFFSNEYDDLSDTSFYMNELQDMANCNKYIGRTANEINGWRDELDVTLKQLQDLKHDYAAGLIPVEELQTYLNNELFGVYQINGSIQKNVGSASNCLNNFNALTNVLDSVRQEWLARQTTNR